MNIPIPPKRQAVEAGVVPAWSCEAILPSRGLRAIGIAPGFGISPHLRHKPWQVDNTRAKSTTNIVQIANSVWSPCRSRSSKFNHSCTSDANLYKHRIRCTLARVNAKSTFELDNDLSSYILHAFISAVPLFAIDFHFDLGFLATTNRRENTNRIENRID